jgi:hypothetical protein
VEVGGTRKYPEDKKPVIDALLVLTYPGVTGFSFASVCVCVCVCVCARMFRGASASRALRVCILVKVKKLLHNTSEDSYQFTCFRDFCQSLQSCARIKP